MILGAAILNTNCLGPGLTEIQASSILPHVSCLIPAAAAQEWNVQKELHSQNRCAMDMGVCLGTKIQAFPTRTNKNSKSSRKNGKFNLETSPRSAVVYGTSIFIALSLQDWLRGECVDVPCWCHPCLGECDARAVEKFRDKEKEVCNPVYSFWFGSHVMFWNSISLCLCLFFPGLQF